MHTSTPTSLGRLVRSLRQERGLTQIQLAKRAKLSRISIIAIESGGHRTVAVSTIRRLGRALDVDPVELFEVAQ